MRSIGIELNSKIIYRFSYEIDRCSIDRNMRSIHIDTRTIEIDMRSYETRNRSSEIDMRSTEGNIHTIGRCKKE